MITVGQRGGRKAGVMPEINLVVSHLTHLMRQLAEKIVKAGLRMVIGLAWAKEPITQRQIIQWVHSLKDFRGNN